MKRSPKESVSKVTQSAAPKRKAPQEPLLSISTFLDRAIHFKQIRPEQKNELRAWFLHHDTPQATLEQFTKLLDQY